MIVVRPPVLIEVGRIRQREADQILDLAEREDHSVRVPLLQVLIEQLILAGLHRSVRFLSGQLQPHVLRLAGMPQ